MLFVVIFIIQGNKIKLESTDDPVDKNEHCHNPIIHG